MKKLPVLLLVFCLQLVPTKAQFVAIPDTNFVTWLTQEYPICMNGNQMDTTCSLIVNEDTIIVSYLNIADLTGLQYFDNLKYLKCNNNLLTSLPNLPAALTYLKCNNNLLNILPQLPNVLILLNCGNNLLTSLPSSPNTLTSLLCNNNQLSNLPQLSTNLIQLDCSSNQLTSLPALPSSLSILSCYYNQIAVLQDPLPSMLTFLCCNFNQITNLPALPSNLVDLQCGHNLLDSIPQLPNALQKLDCYNNQLVSLPQIPSSLTILNCSFNFLVSLPPLPIALNQLVCYNNQLTNLPQLPSTLIHLWSHNNQLTSVPAIPNSLLFLNVTNNQLNYLPPVPNIMNEFKIFGNNISCLNNLPQVGGTNASISNNPLTCVPNQTWYSLGLPLCMDNDPINNPNSCIGVNITGSIYTDLNNNCSYENTDLGTNNIPVKLLDSVNNVVAQSYTYNGVYGFNSLQPGNYQVKIEAGQLPILFGCGQTNIQSVILDSANQTISNINFALACESGYDIDLQSVHAQGLVFPGQIHHLYTDITNNENWYNLDCDSSNSTGTVTITLNGSVTCVSPVLGALTPQINGNTFTYNISNFNNLTINSFGLKLLTDTSAQVGDQICAQVVVSPTPLDSDTTNNTYNYCYNIVNSYDPNMKEVYPIDVLPGYDDWFTYTIHFQNTGNAPAFNIRLRDTLDANLDANTFEILGYSHAANTTISGNILTVRFNNIMLPDSTTDYEGSMGYFQYRIKPLTNLPNGTQIENTAYIYFDYNTPVITNTTQNNFDITVGKHKEITSKNEFILYPNPSSGVFSFKDTKNVKQVEVFNLLGEQIIVQGNQKQINLSGFAKGIYYAKINGEVVVKLVKEKDSD
jgi:uncharacterized repeat protein (TIGR01451 family)